MAGAYRSGYNLKKVQDHYFKRARKEGYPARSVYKLEEVQQKYRFLKKGDRVLDLGCQPGSWSMYAAKAVGPGGLVVGVDLNRGKGIYMTGGARIQIIQGDIMDDGVVETIGEVCDSFSAVISDMAPHTTGNKWADQQQSLRLCRRALRLASALLRKNGAFYCKVFEGEDFKGFLSEVKRYFDSAKVVKPKSSRPESREVFILATAFKGDRLVGKES
jgi:23S rRNA (uridine2552-2'-O)-methyltransferase